MSDTYRVEIFTDQLSFASAALISKVQAIELDYLAYDAFELEMPLMACEKGWFVHIMDGETLIADGVVSDVVPAKTIQKVAIRPLQALFDVEVFPSSIPDAIAWLSQQINAQFISNADTLQNRPVVVTASGSAGGIETDSETINILDIMGRALEAYGVVCDCALDLTQLKVTVSIYQQTATATLESDLDNVLEREVTLGDSYGAANKCIIRETDGETGAVLNTYTYYLHPSGKVDQSNTDRITPVFWVLTSETTEENFATKARNIAVGYLTPRAFDNEIKITYREGDRIARPMEMQIGTVATIYVNGDAYSSLLTGRTIENGAVTLTFGKVRSALTKKLIMERRNTNT